MRSGFHFVVFMGLFIGLYCEQLFAMGNALEDSEDHYPMVRQIVSAHGPCTGTFLNSSVLLTAAHCLVNAENKTIAANEIWIPLNTKVIRALAVHLHPQSAFGFGGQVNIDDAYDVGIVIFPEATSSYHMDIASIPLSEQDVVTMAGYGRLSLFDQSDDNARSRVRRYGTNMVAGLDNRFYLTIASYPRVVERGENVSVHGGDSGGPLIKDGLIYGLHQSGDFQGRMYPDRLEGVSRQYSIILARPEIAKFIRSYTRSR